MQHLDLSAEEAAALVALPTRTIADDRYPLSPRVRVLKEILAKLRLEPLPPSKCMRLRERREPGRGTGSRPVSIRFPQLMKVGRRFAPVGHDDGVSEDPSG